MGSGRILGAGAVLVALVVLGRDPLTCPAHTGFFQHLAVHECHYLNGTEQVRYLYRHIYNQQQRAHYDSDVGHYVADTELGKPLADYWNSLPKEMEQRRAAVDICRYNYFMASFTVDRRVEPKVRVSPMQSSSLPQTDRLACYVTGFYPAEIQVKWFKNGQEETKHVVSTDVIQNGDWTYQVLVMLESTPQHGDTYECHVHPRSCPRSAPSGCRQGQDADGRWGLGAGAHLPGAGALPLRAQKGERPGRWGWRGAGGAALSPRAAADLFSLCCRAHRSPSCR
uniref:Ig-like domain-containing protein n=1 Tax=Anas platyrhynchos TaxID=8839 RepID=A0A8B9R4S0_ANAPL